MNILAVDDEELALYSLCDAIVHAAPQDSLHYFLTAETALAYAGREKVDVAFLDIRMGGGDGIDLAQKLMELNPLVNIIFVTGYSDYMDEAFGLYASGYVKKPVRAKRIHKELENLRHAVQVKVIPVWSLGELSFDQVLQRVCWQGEDLMLKPREYALLRLLAQHLGVYYTPETLYRSLWGSDALGDLSTIYVHISSIRRKLFSLHAKFEIEHRRGNGYRLVALEEA